MEIKQWKRSFVILWTGQAISVFTSSIVQMAIIWYISLKTESAAMLSIATLIGFVPRAVIGMFAGVFIDRHSKKAIMIMADAFIAIQSLILVVIGMAGEIPIWLIMVVLFGRSVGAAFHEPTLQTTTPLIVPKDNLTQYAGFAQGFESISDLLSPVAAAALYAILPLHIIILFDIFGALFASLMLIFVRLSESSVDASKTTRRDFVAEFKDGFRELRRKQGMMLLIVVSALYAVVYFPIGTLFPLMSISRFGQGVGGSAIVETIFAAGTLIGSFLLGIYGSRIRKIPAIAASIGVYGVSLIIIGLLSQSEFIFFVIISFFMGASLPFYYGIKTSIFQLNYSHEYLGRVMSLSSSMTRAVMPIGLILSSAFVGVIGIDTWFLISGIAAVLISSFTARAPSLRNCCE